MTVALPALAQQGKPAAPKHVAKPPQGKGASKPQPQGKGKKGPPKHPRKAGEPGEPDEAVRRAIAGTSGRLVRESPELRAMRELDRALFPGTSPTAGAPWIAEGTPLIHRGDPEVVASGMPPSPSLAGLQPAEPTHDLAWLQKLVMPDIPARWDARVVRYLEFYKNNPRGKSMVAGWIKKSGRYGAAIRRTLRENGLPEDILWLALVESGFDATISSPAGAAGLWQFMPDGARIYGLTVDRWIDERLDPERSTVAAARYLADLHTRFGSWELAFAAYNMGYGGLLASIRKYNTNDFWELSRLESGMPLETALYVPKIVAMAIVSRNKAVFGLDDVELEPAVSFDKIAVRPGVSLQSIALAAGTGTERIAELNPQILAARVPPVGPTGKDDALFTLRVPVGAAPKAAKSLPKFAEAEPKMERHVVRWGESLDEIAARRRTSRGSLAALNGLRREESLRPGTVLFVPTLSPEDAADPFNDIPSGKPMVVVPAPAFSYPDRRRVFYRVVAGDTLREVSSVLGVSAGEICRWNALDPGASLHDGMTLQAFVPPTRDRNDVLVLEEKDALVVPVGSKEFFAHFEGLRGRTRVEVVAKHGDTFRTIAQRYGLTVAQLERINGRARSSNLSPGDKLVCYVSKEKAAAALAALPKHERSPEASPPEPVDEAVAVAGAVARGTGADDAAAKDEGAVKPAVLVHDVSPAKKPDTLLTPAKKPDAPKH
ncbi:Membrane-bound lytic murein transglycosylase D precursor [Minicystis rosea]|nr:Membrane-bound lytic murein transglycosylase D precursor [Minicystis rosea]